MDPRERLTDDLAAGLGAELLLDLDDEEWAARTARAAAAHPELADALWSISFIDVLKRALAHATVEAARARILPQVEYPALRATKITHGLNARHDRDRLRELVHDQAVAGAADVLQQPPGGRPAWPGLWPGDRRRDRHGAAGRRS